MINDFSPPKNQTKVVLFEKREQTIHSTQQYRAQLKIQKWKPLFALKRCKSPKNFCSLISAGWASLKFLKRHSME